MTVSLTCQPECRRCAPRPCWAGPCPWGGWRSPGEATVHWETHAALAHSTPGRPAGDLLTYQQGVCMVYLNLASLLVLQTCIKYVKIINYVHKYFCNPSNMVSISWIRIFQLDVTHHNHHHHYYHRHRYNHHYRNNSKVSPNTDTNKQEYLRQALSWND